MYMPLVVSPGPLVNDVEPSFEINYNLSVAYMTNGVNPVYPMA
jgi:hypothetical protein